MVVTNLSIFFVPNYSGVFLRGLGSQTLNLQIPSSPKNFMSPGLGLFVTDKSVQPSNYVNGIIQAVRSFITSTTLIGAPTIHLII